MMRMIFVGNDYVVVIGQFGGDCIGAESNDLGFFGTNL